MVPIPADTGRFGVREVKKETGGRDHGVYLIVLSSQSRETALAIRCDTLNIMFIDFDDR